MRRKEGILSPPGSHQLSLAQAHRVSMPEPGTGCGRRTWFPASKTRSTGERNPGGQLEEAARAGRGVAQEPPVTPVWSPAQAGAPGRERLRGACLAHRPRSSPGAPSLTVPCPPAPLPLPPPRHSRKAQKMKLTQDSPQKAVPLDLSTGLTAGAWTLRPRMILP